MDKPLKQNGFDENEVIISIDNSSEEKSFTPTRISSARNSRSYRKCQLSSKKNSLVLVSKKNSLQSIHVIGEVEKRQ